MSSHGLFLEIHGLDVIEVEAGGVHDGCQNTTWQGKGLGCVIKRK